MNDNGTSPTSRAALYAKRVTWFFSSFVLLGIIMACFFNRSLQSFATVVMWILATSIVGAGVGFLFGIPKVLQSRKPKEGEEEQSKEDYHLQVNTNLTDISDWLTKIIVGLGLVKLAQLPPYVTSVADALARGIDIGDKQGAMAFAYGIISCYSLSGFLFGYLITRLSLSKGFSEADQEARQIIRQMEAAVQSTQAKVASIESRQGLITQTLYPENPLERTVAERGLVAEPSAKERVLEQLRQMADDYLSIKHPDASERLYLKDNAANAMAEYAMRSGVTKTDIAGLLSENHNEGLVLALAVLITIRPERSDFDTLYDASINLNRLHVRYRVLMALVALCERKLLPSSAKGPILELLQKFRKDADYALLDMIKYTKSLVNTVL